MAGQARVPDQGALHSELLPAPRSDRAVMGADASPRDPQPKPPELQRLLPIRSAFPARGGAEKLGRLLRFGYRQFPRHQPCRFSGSQGVGVYYFGKDPTFAFGTCIPFGLNSRMQTAWMYFGGGMELMNDFYRKFNIYGVPA